MACRVVGGGILKAGRIRHLGFADPELELQLQALEVSATGTLRLARVPATPVPLDVDLGGVLAGIAGAAVGPDGAVYLADTARDRIVRVDCDGVARPLACLEGPGTAPGLVRGPRGLAFGPRSALYVADSGNHRVQVIDLPTLQLRGVWGQPDPYAEPEPSGEIGRFDEPWDVAADSACRVYVVEHGNRRIQRFDADGIVDDAFRQALEADPPEEPTHVAVGSQEEEERLLVLDRRKTNGATRSHLLVYRLDGTIDAEATTAWARALAGRLAGTAGAVAAGEGVVYVADLAGERLLAFRLDGSFTGVARGFRGRAAALALDAAGRLIVQPAAGGAATALARDAAFADAGSFVLGPVPVDADADAWHRLRVFAESLPEGAHIRFFTHGTSLAGRPPPFPGDDAAAWTAAPLDALDLRVESDSAPFLWLAGLLESDGATSPELHGLLLAGKPSTWLEWLPATYARDDEGRELLERILSLFESVLDDQEAAIDALPSLFDAAAAPDHDAPDSWLDWLSRWVAVELDESWDEDRRRDAVATGFGRHGRRGTPDGLRELAELALDMRIFVSEPARHMSLWQLGGSPLGFETMLAPAEADGAVLGTTAVLDGSHLTARADRGVPLYADLAHRFCVTTYASELRHPDAREALGRLVEREKPAHTQHRICTIEPRFRVGFQARIGVDAIVGAGPSSPDQPPGSVLGVDTQLTASPDRMGGLVGETAVIGRGTTLT